MSDNIAGWIRTPDNLVVLHKDDEELAGPATRHPSAYGRVLSLPPLRLVRE